MNKVREFLAPAFCLARRALSGRRAIFAMAMCFFFGMWLILTAEIETATNAYIVTMTVASGIFVVLYGVRSRWRETQPGRALMYTNLAFFALGLQICFSVLLGTEYWGRGVMRLFLYMSLALTMINLNLTLFRVQNEAIELENAMNRKSKEGQVEVPIVITGPIEIIDQIQSVEIKKHNDEVPDANSD